MKPIRLTPKGSPIRLTPKGSPPQPESHEFTTCPTCQGRGVVPLETLQVRVMTYQVDANAERERLREVYGRTAEVQTEVTTDAEEGHSPAGPGSGVEPTEHEL